MQLSINFPNSHKWLFHDWMLLITCNHSQYASHLQTFHNYDTDFQDNDQWIWVHGVEYAADVISLHLFSYCIYVGMENN
jgi:hypothetical protein